MFTGGGKQNPAPEFALTLGRGGDYESIFDWLISTEDGCPVLFFQQKRAISIFKSVLSPTRYPYSNTQKQVDP